MGVIADNRGARALRGIGLQQGDLAAAIGLEQGMVSRWWRGERKPSAKYRWMLEQRFGIAWELWDEESK